MADFDCIVIGGGLSGLLTAHELAQAGMRVRLLERQELGRESSWAGGGILSPLQPWRYADPVNVLANWSQANYPELAEHLAQETGIDPEWTRSGMLILDVPLAERDDAVAWAVQFDTQLEFLAGATLAAMEPALAWSGEHAVDMPEVAQIRNPRLLKALLLILEVLRVRIERDTEVTAISHDPAGHPCVLANGETLCADVVVVAAGAWSNALLAPLGYPVPIEPVKGQMLLYKAAPDLLRHIILKENRYLIPRQDGHILVGSTLEHVGFDKATSDEARADLRAVALELVPALGEFPIVRQWAGLRPGSPDGIPMIGPVPDAPGVYVNAGHYRNGVVMGLASARLTADMVLGRHPVLDPTPYLPTPPAA